MHGTDQRTVLLSNCNNGWPRGLISKPTNLLCLTRPQAQEHTLFKTQLMGQLNGSHLEE